MFQNVISSELNQLKNIMPQSIPNEKYNGSIVMA
jgi:hypothetical protein